MEPKSVKLHGFHAVNAATGATEVLCITIKGAPRTKKNSSQIVTINGRPRLIPSKPYREYEKVFIPQVPESCKAHIDTPVTAKYVYYMDTRRKCDLVGLMQATNDLLVKAGVLADDNCQIVYSHDGSRVNFDKENPRVVITIIPQAWRII